MSKSTKNILAVLSTKKPLEQNPENDADIDALPARQPQLSPGLAMNELLAQCLTRKDDLRLTPPA